MLRASHQARVYLLALVVALLLAACAQPTATPPAAEEEAAPAAEEEAAPAAEKEAAPAAEEPGVVNVYSARHYGAVEEVFERFTAETGIEVRLSQGSDQSLVERILAEGTQTPADAVITINAGTTQLLADEGVLASIDSEVIAAAIPAELRDPDGYWVGLSQRIRTIMYNPEAVDEANIPSDYADLADPLWQGRLCLRPATHIYTIALVASMIENYGEERTEEIVSGWVANNPTYIDSDTRILETMEAGGCDVGITNHYYLARILSENPDFVIQPVWANQETSGVHRNLVSMSILASARNPENAVALMEWLATEGQGATSDTLPGSNFEYPASPAAEVHPVLAEFGEPTIDMLAPGIYGRNQAAAIQLLESTGYGFNETVAGQ
ncbi:MAG: extracellular solute-binding protein [Chloroflexaceae bacterium]|nr:extracellular solute-binding protein [Chloroflexaceae bacterium]